MQLSITYGPYRVRWPYKITRPRKASVIDIIRQFCALDRGRNYLILPAGVRFECVACPTTVDVDPLWPFEAY